jgi:hypothetical protein
MVSVALHAAALITARSLSASARLSSGSSARHSSTLSGSVVRLAVVYSQNSFRVHSAYPSTLSSEAYSPVDRCAPYSPCQVLESFHQHDPPIISIRSQTDGALPLRHPSLSHSRNTRSRQSSSRGYSLIVWFHSLQQPMNLRLGVISSSTQSEPETAPH